MCLCRNNIALQRSAISIEFMGSARTGLLRVFFRLSVGFSSGSNSDLFVVFWAILTAGTENAAPTPDMPGQSCGLPPPDQESIAAPVARLLMDAWHGTSVIRFWSWWSEKVQPEQTIESPARKACTGWCHRWTNPTWQC